MVGLAVAATHTTTTIRVQCTIATPLSQCHAFTIQRLWNGEKAKGRDEDEEQQHACTDHPRSEKSDERTGRRSLPAVAARPFSPSSLNYADGC